MRRVLLSGKVGQAMYFVIAIVIILVLLVAMLNFQQKFRKSLETKETRDACKLSVLAASKLRFADFQIIDNIQCCQENKVVDNPDKIPSMLANSLYDCYKMFLKGEADLFAGPGRLCFVCSTIDFEDAGKKITQLTEFNKYLFENYANTKETHAQYLYKDQTEKTRETLKKTGEYTKTRPVQKLGIIFTYDRGLTSDTKWDILKGGAVGGAGAIIAIALAPISVPTILATAIVAGGAYAGGYGVYTLGEFTRLTGVTLKPYSADELNKLGCTQNIVQKPT